MRGEAGTIALDAQRILRDARALAFPRYPGTQGDREAIALVRRLLEETGLDVAVEEFSYDIRPAFRGLRSLMVSCALLAIAAGLAASRWPAVAFVLVVVAAVAGGTFLGWAPWLEGLYRNSGPTRTANVVARRRVDDPALILAFVAHHDSKSQNLTLPWRAGMTQLALLGAVGLLVLLLADALSPGMVPGSSWLPVAFGGTAGAALLVLSTLKNGNASPGGVDNAGSVGILVELARVLPGRLPETVELVFLSPGAEEDHMVGAMRWLDRHLGELTRRPHFAINLDGAGIPGRVVLLERYGFGRMFSRTLSRIARRAAATLGEPLRGVLLPPAMGVDAIPFAHRGVECLTVTSGSLGRATLAVHSAADVADNLDGAVLERVTRLAVAMAEELVGEMAPGAQRGEGAQPEPGEPAEQV